MTTQYIKIGIVDDDQLIVELLRDYLDLQLGFNVILKANSGQECLDTLANDLVSHPDVLLVDLRMKQMDGTELIKQIRDLYPVIKTIVISSHYQDSFLGFMVKNGTAAFLPKGIAAFELVRVIREVCTNGFFLLPSQVEILREQISSRAVKPKFATDLLTDREIMIIKLIAQQKTAKEIADVLFITQRTVEGHKNNLFAKTGTKNIAGLVLFAIQQEIIDANEFPN
ncbi:response regulator [Sphingobacterium anhuiense]|uniref:response regulator n=1 Tax=Sphingobacterium anhuiense TaxID=493780 RepID=UPI003C2BA569